MIILKKLELLIGEISLKCKMQYSARDKDSVPMKMYTNLNCYFTREKESFISYNKVSG